MSSSSAQPGEAYRQQLIRYQRRRGIARVVRLVTVVIALLLAVVGAALAATALQGTAPGTWVATHFVPGEDGSITLPRDDDYAITRPGGDLPACQVHDRGGRPLELHPHEEPADPPLPAHVFAAVAGQYRVACEGGNDDIVVYRFDELSIVTRGYWHLLARALPLLAGAVAVYWVGRLVASRVAPEKLLPTVAS